METDEDKPYFLFCAFALTVENTFVPADLRKLILFFLLLLTKSPSFPPITSRLSKLPLTWKQQITGFTSPTGIAVGRNGDIIVAAAETPVFIFSSAGILRSTFGPKGKGDGELSTPRGVAINLLGDILVADFDNHRIQTFSRSGKFISNFGKMGKEPGKLMRPFAVAVTQSGNILVSEYDNDRISTFNPQGVYLSYFWNKGADPGLFICPRGLAVNNEGDIIVVDEMNSRVQIFNSEGVFLRELKDKFQALDAPAFVVVDRTGNIVVSDSCGHRFVIWDRNGEVIRAIGKPGKGNSEFLNPRGLAINNEGNLLVADMNNNRLQVFE